MYPITPLLTDEATLTELGRRLEQHRLRLNLTQAELANQAGIAKRTVERIEDGASCQITGFLRVLRVLGLSENLNLLLPAPSPTPIELLNAQKKPKRQRASKPRHPKTETLDESQWTWGE